jgi:hypothetical protein
VPPSVAPRTRVGTVLGDRYRIDRLIARGGMGDVFEAEDERLHRRVAVKVFRSGPAADRKRFDSEIRVLASLDHPGLVRVFDAGEHDGDAFVVLELVDGPTLASRLPDGPLSPEEAADLGIALADALAYVHERGVVHRDVTPSNVLCGSDGRPRLADFGIARLVGGTRLTASATTIGTAAYMAPEQVQGHEVTPAADVYALGLVLLEVLTGRRAFEGTVHEVAVARLTRSPDTTTGVPGPWRGLLASMTGRAAEARPTAAEVRDRLADVIAAAARTAESTGVGPALVVADGADLVAPAGDVTTVLDSDATRTTVLPAALVPASEPSRGAVAAGTLAARAWSRRWLLAAIGLIGLVVLAAAALGGDGLETPPPSTAPVATEAPTTTQPPTTTTTTAPPDDDEDEERGEGRGKGRKGKDDDD